MKSFGRYLLFGLFAVSAFLGCNKEPMEQMKLELDRTNMKMTVGQSQRLNAELKGAEGEIVWESDSPEIATVDASGVVTAVAAGKANVIASSMGVKQTCAVQVVNFSAAKLELNEKFHQVDDSNRYTYTIAKGNTVDLEPKFYNADGEKVNEMAYPKFGVVDVGQDVASVDENGVVEALSAGVVTVRISGAGLEAFVTITVKSVELSKSEMTLWVNQQDILTVAVLPQNLTDTEKEVTWSSSNEEYVSVSSTGVVTALKSTDGIEPVSVMATCGDIIAECKVTVSDYKIDEIKLSNLDGLKAADDSYQLLVGDNPYTLEVKFFKDGEDVTATVKSLNITTDYSSSDENVATVKGGVITPVGPGTAEIVVGCAGESYAFSLNVIQCVENIVITSPQNPYNASVEDEFTIEYKILPENASVKTARFESSDTEVAVVDNNGKVTVKKDGQVVIKVISDGKKKPYTNSTGETAQEPAVANLMVIVGNTDSDQPASLSIAGEGVENGSLVIMKGEKAQLRPVVEPADYSGGFIWSTTTDGVASITDAGLLSAESRGETEVVLLASGATAKLPVRVVGIDPTAIKIDQKLEKISTSDIQHQLSASVVSPENADLVGVNWYSSNEELATIDSNGLLKPLKKGTVTITAKAISDLDGNEISSVSASVTFEITADPVSQIILPTGVMVEVGESKKLEYQVLPTGADIKEVAWTIEDGKDLASIDGSGVITGINSERIKDAITGVSSWRKVTVKVTADGVSATGQVAIIPRQPKDIALTLPQNNTMRINESWDFNPVVLPSDLEGFFVESYGTKPDGAYFTPSLRNFVPEVPGLYSLTAYVGSNDNLVYQRQKGFAITVDPYWVQSISVPATYEIDQGGSAILVPEFTSDVTGLQPYDKSVKWTSSNESIVKVDANGKITAVAPGTAEVKVTTNGSWSVPGGQSHKSASCIVTVNAVATVINVGDYFYSDGTTSSEIVPGKTVVGIVISRDNARSTDVRLPESCTHGLVLALGQGEGNWSSSYDAGKVNTWALDNGYQNTTGVYYSGGYVTNEFGKRLLGYNNTSALRGYLAQYEYTSGIVAALDAYAATVTLPSSASEMYIPSIAEMQMIHNNFDIINAALETAGGTTFVRDQYDTQKDLYWTTSENESSSGNAAALNPFTGELHGGVLKGSGVKKVRYIFAF